MTQLTNTNSHTPYNRQFVTRSALSSWSFECVKKLHCLSLAAKNPESLYVIAKMPKFKNSTKLPQNSHNIIIPIKNKSHKNSPEMITTSSHNNNPKTYTQNVPQLIQGLS